MRAWACVGLAALLAAAGCGEGTVQERTTPPEVEYAQDTRDAILELEALAKTNMAAAKREIIALVENYQDYEHEPLGEHKATYDAIVAGLRELERMVRSGAPDAQLRAKVAEVAAAARKLPAQ